MARNFAALEQRHLRVLGEREHPRVEVEPGELAVQEAAWIARRRVITRMIWGPGRRRVRSPGIPIGEDSVGHRSIVSTPAPRRSGRNGVFTSRADG